MITAADIQAVIERPLTADEFRVIPKWIEQAEEKLRREIRDLNERMALAVDAPAYLSIKTVKTVLVRMVERKTRNANGYRQVSSDGAQITVDSENSSGKIYLSEEDLADLAPTPVTTNHYPGAFSLRVDR